MRNKFYFVFLIMTLTVGVSGCLFLPLGLAGHIIHEGNQQYDDIIVNFGYKYKLYHKEYAEKNVGLLAAGGQEMEIMPFCEWIQTQVNSDKERKAVKRYIRMNGCSAS